MPETTYRPPRPVDVRLTLGSLRRGSGDPCQRVVGGVVWRTWRTPEGPATLALQPRAGGAVDAAAWGPGAEWALAGVPDLLGARDDDTGFVPGHPLLRQAAQACAGLRVPRCGRVFEVLVPSVLEQKVTGLEARASWRWLLGTYGEPAPGPAPAGMRVFPEPAAWRAVPSYVWHRAGVDGRRSRTILAAASVAARLEEALEMTPAAAAARLRAVPGVGAWTVAEVAQRACGDADAVSVGDFHLPSLVGWALLGRPVDDAGMLEVLAPYSPQRYRAVRLVELSGFRPPRFGPRLAAGRLPEQQEGRRVPV